MKDATVLILGGGASGIIAAKAFRENDTSDFKIIEVRNELGGRLRTKQFSGVTVEVQTSLITS